MCGCCYCFLLSQLGGQLRSLHKLPVGYVALDWHQMDKELGSEALVEAFWTQLSALLPPQVGHFSCLSGGIVLGKRSVVARGLCPRVYLLWSRASIALAMG
jgi:hypothetical protein